MVLSGRARPDQANVTNHQARQRPAEYISVESRSGWNMTDLSTLARVAAQVYGDLLDHYLRERFSTERDEAAIAPLAERYGRGVLDPRLQRPLEGRAEAARREGRRGGPREHGRPEGEGPPDRVPQAALEAGCGVGQVMVTADRRVHGVP